MQKGKPGGKKPSLAQKLNRKLSLRLLGIFLLLDGVFAAVLLNMGQGVRVAAVLVVAVELVVLLVNQLSNAGLIKKTLKPLSDLSQTVAQLTRPHGAGREELAQLALQLERIDAEALDTRLSAGEGQGELRELTDAINALLERIDGAYAAQIRFVSDASHELRTPIAVIQGYANLLNRWGKDDPAARQEAIDAISAEAETMKRLVEQLLFLARGDNHTQKLEPREVDATELAAQVLRETAMLDQTHPLAADWSEGVTVRADPDLVKEGLRILMDNAVKYTPAGGQITLRVRREGGEVRLSVEDRGQGIAPQELDRVFQRFYRTDASRARQTGGSGLGLSIALWIAAGHGGHLEVISCPNLGSEFTLALPCAE